MIATARTCRPYATTTDPQPQHALVERMGLKLSFAAEDAVESIKLGALQAVDSPQFSKLILAYSDDSERSNKYKTVQTVLRSVLDRKRLTWALESRKLQFEGPGGLKARSLRARTSYRYRRSTPLAMSPSLLTSHSRPNGYCASRQTRQTNTCRSLWLCRPVEGPLRTQTLVRVHRLAQVPYANLLAWSHIIARRWS